MHHHNIDMTSMMVPNVQVIDNVGDVSVMQIKAKQAQESAQKQANMQMNQLVDNQGAPPLAAPDPNSAQYVDPNYHPQPLPSTQESTSQQELVDHAEKFQTPQRYLQDRTGWNRIIQRTVTTADDEVVYNSLDRPIWYHAFAWLWCGCFEPKYKITTTYVMGEQWRDCSIVTDSMAMENVTDVQRRQNCCFAMVSCCPCCPCFNDMADILILGTDDSTPDGVWRLKRIHRSQEVFDDLTKVIQSTHSEWRKQGRNLGRKMQQVKHDTEKP